MTMTKTLNTAIENLNSDLRDAALFLATRGAASAVQFASATNRAISTAYFCMNELVVRGLAIETTCRDSNGHADFVLADEDMVVA